MYKRVFTVITVLVLFLSLPTNQVIAQSIGYQVYLPIISSPETPPPPPTPPTPSGDNVQCATSGSAQICAWVSNGNPVQNSLVVVYGMLLINNVGQAGQPMVTSWHYKTTTPGCNSSTDESGVANCGRTIGNATLGYRVNINVSIGGYGVTTWFTPQ